MPPSTLKIRNSPKTSAKATPIAVRAKKMPLPGQPGFDIAKALAEERRIADSLPVGSVFRSPATGSLVVKSKPITSEEVYAHFY
jgi:alcohol dehydrogenase YqhD (iron-dependent ADH family)